MPPAAPGILELALHLRHLRIGHWTGSGLTQAALAKALGGNEPLAAATVASWENRSKPKLPPPQRILAYAQFFATQRSIESRQPALVPIDSFMAEERDEYDKLREELLRLHAAASGAASELEALPAPRTWQFADDGPLTIICAQLPPEQMPQMAKRENPNYTELLSFADLDAMVELYGHVRSENPDMYVFRKSAPNVSADDLSGHIVIIGGIGWNDITGRLLDLARLPVEQREDADDEFGGIFVTEEADGERKHLATWSPASRLELIEDVGLLVRMPNPLNSSRTLTMCNGIHSRGVHGAARSLTDRRLCDSNERYIAKNLPGQQFGILMRVQIISGETMTPDFSNPRTILHQWSAEA